MKTVKIGGLYWTAPFVARGLWVEDAKGNSLGEFVIPQIAVGIAALLNATYNVTEKK